MINDNEALRKELASIVVSIEADSVSVRVSAFPDFAVAKMTECC